MTAHQLIFTSCRRGINGVNDGQQVYSYDDGFPESLVPRIAPSMTYKGPDLPPGVAMSQALVPGYPRSFSHELLAEGVHHFAMKTYLGKDYMGPTGRFGNFLSHHVVSDQVAGNPVEFYESEAFRSAMGYDDVNNPDPPPHLPAPVLTPGSTVSFDTVREFLGQADRWQVFTRMAACLLAGDAHEHRLIVHDHPRNVVQWFAALLYMVPAAIAQTVSFSTYEYDPMNGERRMVGAVAEGTAYKPDGAGYLPLGSPYVVDVIAGTAPALDLPPRFADFVEVGLLISPESLLEFHKFVAHSYPRYFGVDQDLFGAQAVYLQQRGDLDAAGLPLATDFLARFGTPEQQQAFVKDAFARPDASASLHEAVTVQPLLDLLNASARSESELFDLTYHAEGHLLDGDNLQESVDLVWTNFYREALRSYPKRRVAIYRQLIDDNRRIEAQRLFTLALVAESAPARNLFDEVTAELDSPVDYPPFIDIYYRHCNGVADREHLLRFIMTKKVSFEAAGELVDSALSVVEFGSPSREQVRLVESVWQWALASGFEVRRSPRLWNLAAGVMLMNVKDSDELSVAVDWIVETAREHRLSLAVDDPAFVEWILPQLIRRASSGRRLYAAMTKLEMRFTPATRDLLFKTAIGQFNLNRWLKIAECIYSAGDEQLLLDFANACKKLSNRELAVLQEAAVIRYAKNKEFMPSWETVYAATQTTPGRMVKAWMGRGGAERDRRT